MSANLYTSSTIKAYHQQKFIHKKQTEVHVGYSQTELHDAYQQR